jgi:hypothetical protein
VVRRAAEKGRSTRGYALLIAVSYIPTPSYG